MAMDESSEARETESPALRTRRIFADGEVWTVREVPAPAFDRRGSTHLIFEGLDVMRRVRVFPRDWITLAENDLYALSVDIRNP